ncbi:MAG TPA: bifunctional phosphopantothenoylcysteine decarboxylase/phosphopantothenate--cysteine ligase CoaBC [Baekduia sp.]|uniref:bifunctional phosphopantothenoylcysteine decarboxylase/phosphopantothenate--cysteine ligase CoaBC n=1 Tax=Baekduia sp. TaxID=2600305 RepID=UPI002BC63764|nr:bifunctional phosphopantothenoylcysteine decarboxylase/phosphopantothenate--cysteine ligase CoaBC [Baekduia sp.]HMJ36620.1 bifunctional phosphopantothenoylcysteine decarboxylase/phosphopantothenate--cysteine ligase CoaBC [Baekduia sp.]
MARLLLGVSGGIAAYKALEVVRLATKAGHAVRAIQTPTAQRFVGAASFAALTGAPVLTDEFERDPARGAFGDQKPPSHDPASHLELVRNADAYLIAPASANTIAKLAHGLADNLLTSAALAASCPVLVAPAMNHHMWEHPATQANLALLRDRGVAVIDPGTGALATKHEWGTGRLAEPAELLAAVEAVVEFGPAHPRPWDGLKVLITAGGTREPIDAVRYVGNRSSGRMGFAVAEEAAALGADVTVIAANVHLARDPRVRYVDVETAAELGAACAAEFPVADVLVMAAAVSDFRPATAVDGKVKKTGRDELALVLEPTADVLSGLAAQRRPEQTLVGFAAEHGAGALDYGRDKLTRKGLDAVVVNDVSQAGIGFDAVENEVTILTASGDEHVPRATKAEVARAILGTIDRLRTDAAARS